MLYRRKTLNLRPREAFLARPAGKMPHCARQRHFLLEVHASRLAWS
jgi:hypothetical protein